MANQSIRGKCSLKTSPGRLQRHWGDTPLIPPIAQVILPVSSAIAQLEFDDVRSTAFSSGVCQSTCGVSHGDDSSDDVDDRTPCHFGPRNHNHLIAVGCRKNSASRQFPPSHSFDPRATKNDRPLAGISVRNLARQITDLINELAKAKRRIGQLEQ
jgi:hypothetical protein